MATLSRRIPIPSHGPRWTASCSGGLFLDHQTRWFNHSRASVDGWTSRGDSSKDCKSGNAILASPTQGNLNCLHLVFANLVFANLVFANVLSGGKVRLITDGFPTQRGFNPRLNSSHYPYRIFAEGFQPRLISSGYNRFPLRVALLRGDGSHCFASASLISS